MVSKPLTSFISIRWRRVIRDIQEKDRYHVILGESTFSEGRNRKRYSKTLTSRRAMGNYLFTTLHQIAKGRWTGSHSDQNTFLSNTDNASHQLEETSALKAANSYGA